MNKKLLYIAIMFLVSAKVVAQVGMPDKNDYYRYGNNLYMEIFQNPTPNLDSLNISILYRLAYDELVFEQISDNKYFAIASIEISFKDPAGITRKRIITADTIHTNSFEETISKKISFSNMAKIKLAMSNYEVTAKILKAKSTKTNVVELSIKDFISIGSQHIILEPFFVKPTGVEGHFAPFICNKFVPFSGASDIAILIPVSYDAKNTLFEYTVSSKKNAEREKIWGEFKSLSGICNILKNKYVNVFFDSNNNIGIDLQDIEYNSSKNSIGLLNISLRSTRFSPGFYELKLRNVRTNEEKTIPFEVRWEDIPLSLVNSTYAVDKMYYILTDREYNQMKKGNDTEKYKKIIEYWQAKDPTPTTLYNEAMTEYFRRVDYTFFNYQTIFNKDGSKTDKGMIYILNGLPNFVETTIDNKISKEIWTYDKLKKSYIFELVSVENYKLVEIKDLK